jgi:glycosyltransferase EpsF
MAKVEYCILHVLDHLTVSSGVAGVVVNCIRTINSFKQDVVVYGKADCELETTVEEHGGKVFKIPDIRLSCGQAFRKGFSRILHEQSYCIVHGHLINSAFLYLREAKRQNVPHRIIHAHSTVSADSTLKRIRNNILSAGIPRWANHYIACSSKAAHRMFHKQAAETTVIHNGIDVSRFRNNQEVRQNIRRELGISDDVLCIGNVARFVPQKNHAFLLDVFSLIRAKIPCMLMLAGDGPLEESIKNKAASMGLANSVQFLGARSDIEKFYQGFDLFLLPSLFEGFGLVVVEAQCAGLPCIVSDRVPREIACGSTIRYLSLGNKSLWVETIQEFAHSTRTDGSTSVTNAGFDIASMRNKLKTTYESFFP